MNPLKRLQAAFQYHLGIDNLRYQAEGIQGGVNKLRPMVPLIRDLYAAEIFHDRIKESPWFVRQRLSPGRWAVDYGFLKTLYNVLSAMRPRNILEFGLGQSSKLIHQYAAHYQADAVTCEHNDEWISFFFQSEADFSSMAPADLDQPVVEDASLGYPMKIRRLPLERVKIHGAETTAYGGLEDAFGVRKFDFVLVDGPVGEKRFSRSQIISVAKTNLADRFCIMMDDTERPGEQETLDEVQEVLRGRGVLFASETFEFSKSHTVILSPSLHFLATS